MGATLKYVKEFDFGPQKSTTKASACSCGGPVNKARGGPVIPPQRPPRLKQRPQERALDHVRMMQETRAAERAMPTSRGMPPTVPPGTIPLKKGGPAKKPMKKADGGTVKNPETGEDFPSRAALAAHEADETPAMKRYEARTGREAMPMRKKGVPAASMSPLIVIALGHKGKGKG
jgi:hypothetical protein